jgi:hypothetical protein
MQYVLWFGLTFVAWLAACGGDDGGGNTGQLVDELYEVEAEQDMLECACDGTCTPEAPSEEEVECVKAVVAKYADQIGPELRCEIDKMDAQNDCYVDADCSDSVAWEACYDAGGDCDDSFTESVENEFEPCR